MLQQTTGIGVVVAPGGGLVGLSVGFLVGASVGGVTSPGVGVLVGMVWLGLSAWTVTSPAPHQASRRMKSTPNTTSTSTRLLTEFSLMIYALPMEYQPGFRPGYPAFRRLYRHRSRDRRRGGEGIRGLGGAAPIHDF